MFHYEVAVSNHGCDYAQTNLNHMVKLPNVSELLPSGTHYSKTDTITKVNWVFITGWGLKIMDRTVMVMYN